MSKPTGLLLSPGAIAPDAVSHALNEQGGPAWDNTVFRLLSGVDVRSLAEGAPKRGSGTAVSLASTGWWFRPLDELADRLAATTGQPVLALLEHPGVGSAYHLAQPGDEPVRRVRLGTDRLWAEGVALLTGGEGLAEGDTSPLEQAARLVHGDDPEGAQLPGMVAFAFLPERRAEWPALLDLRGQALQGGVLWKPAERRDADEDPPMKMRAILLETDVRLPGPPRWARAHRAEVIETAQQVVGDDGWVCLVPQVDGEVAAFGAAVRILQLAPLPDGSLVGVLHPLAGVRIEGVADGVATVDPVPQGPVEDAEAFTAARKKLVEQLAAGSGVRWSAEELDASTDPASLIAWQVRLSTEACQSYLAAREPLARLAALDGAL